MVTFLIGIKRMNNFTETENKAKVLIDPMLDLFGGADGGVGFIKMRQLVINTMERQNKSVVDAQLLEMFERFSLLCKLLIGKEN